VLSLFQEKNIKGMKFMSSMANLIQSATEGDQMDLQSICKALGVKLKSDDCMTDLGNISTTEDGVYIRLNKKSDLKTKYTVIVLALSEYILTTSRVTATGISYDMFFMKDMSAKKYSPSIMLAIRLAIPEHIIEKIASQIESEFDSKKIAVGETPFDVDKYINESKFLPQFLRCSIKENTAMYLLDKVHSPHI